MNRKSIQTISFLFALLLMISAVHVASAAVVPPALPPGATTPPGTPPGAPIPVSNPSPTYFANLTDLGDLVYRVIDWLIYLSGALAVAFLLVGGFQYVVSRGNEEGTEKAKKTIYGAILGLIVVIMAYAIITIVENLIIDAPEASTALHQIENQGT